MKTLLCLLSFIPFSKCTAQKPLPAGTASTATPFSNLYDYCDVTSLNPSPMYCFVDATCLEGSDNTKQDMLIKLERNLVLKEPSKDCNRALTIKLVSSTQLEIQIAWVDKTDLKLVMGTEPPKEYTITVNSLPKITVTVNNDINTPQFTAAVLDSSPAGNRYSVKFGITGPFASALDLDKTPPNNSPSLTLEHGPNKAKIIINLKGIEHLLGNCDEKVLENLLPAVSPEFPASTEPRFNIYGNMLALEDSCSNDATLFDVEIKKFVRRIFCKAKQKNSEFVIEYAGGSEKKLAPKEPTELTCIPLKSGCSGCPELSELPNPKNGVEMLYTKGNGMKCSELQCPPNYRLISKTNVSNVEYSHRNPPVCYMDPETQKSSWMIPVRNEMNIIQLAEFEYGYCQPKSDCDNQFVYTKCPWEIKDCSKPVISNGALTCSNGFLYGLLGEGLFPSRIDRIVCDPGTGELSIAPGMVPLDPEMPVFCAPGEPRAPYENENDRAEVLAKIGLGSVCAVMLLCFITTILTVFLLRAKTPKQPEVVRPVKRQVVYNKLTKNVAAPEHKTTLSKIRAAFKKTATTVPKSEMSAQSAKEVEYVDDYNNRLLNIIDHKDPESIEKTCVIPDLEEMKKIREYERRDDYTSDEDVTMGRVKSLEKEREE